MKVVIIGSGKVGRSLIKYLSNENHDITIIDNNKEALEMATNVFDVQGILANGTIKKVQTEAGVPKADMVIAVTDKDELNMVCCATAKNLGAKCTIARVRDTDYMSDYEFLKETLNIDYIVNPEQSAAEEIYNILRFPSALKVHSFEKGKVIAVELLVPEDCILCGLALKDLDTKFSEKVIISSVLRGEEVVIPDGEFALQAGDRINVVANPARLRVFFKEADIFNKRAKNVLIIGGSRISFYLSKLLVEDGIRVKIIEKTEKRCKELLETLDKVEIIHADGAHKNVLDEENISSYDACIGLTNLDEQNIVISLYAKSKLVDTVISKVSTQTFIEILDDIDLNTYISPKEVVANQIVLYSRSIRATTEQSPVSLYKTLDDKAELLEYNVGEDEDFVGKAINQLKLKDDIIVASIIRKGQVVIPSGKEVLCEKDSIIVSATGKVIKKVEDILK